MEEDFWEKHLEKRRKEIEEEDRIRKERIERANREEKSWELAREIRKLIEETNGSSWFRDKELRKEKEKAEKEKKMRLENVKRKKRELENTQKEKRKQTTLLDMMRKLPGKEREIYEMEERKIKRLELQEIKTNIWRKWRGKGREEKVKESNADKRESEIIRKTKKIEELIDKHANEKKEKEMRNKEWRERQKKLLEAGRVKQEEKERKEREKKARLEKKASLEEKWTRLRWVTQFIDENKDKWERWRRERENDARESLESWDDMDRENKINMLRERMGKTDWRQQEKPRVAQTSPPVVPQEMQATVLVKPYRRPSTIYRENLQAQLPSVAANPCEDLKACMPSERVMNKSVKDGQNEGGYINEGCENSENIAKSMPESSNIELSLASWGKEDVLAGKDPEMLSLAENEPGIASEGGNKLQAEKEDGLSLAECENVTRLLEMGLAAEKTEIGLSLA